MNPLPPNVDELVSAYLDGEAAPDEVVTVESSPELMQRVELMRSVSAQLGATLIPPPAQKEAHISAALDAFDALFATSATQDINLQSADSPGPVLAAVPTAGTADGPDSPSAHTHDVGTPEQPAGVVSLERERTRRRPRRFNTSVIAAAAAVMLLFVAAAALSFGRGSNSEDVATAASSAEQASDDAGKAAGDAADEASDGVSSSALRELPPAAEPQDAAAMPEVAGAQAAESDAMADDVAAMDDAGDQEESFAANSADSDSADSDSAESADEAEGLLYYLGDFDNRAALKARLENVTVEDLLASATEFEPGLFLPCLSEIPELADVEPDQILAEAFLEDEGLILAEIFIDTARNGTSDIYVVDSDGCTLILVLEGR